MLCPPSPTPIPHIPIKQRRNPSASAWNTWLVSWLPIPMVREVQVFHHYGQPYVITASRFFTIKPLWLAKDVMCSGPPQQDAFLHTLKRDPVVIADVQLPDIRRALHLLHV